MAGSVTSSAGSLRLRRPLISPARLNLQGQKLLLFPAQSEALLSPGGSEEHTHPDSHASAPELPGWPRKSLLERAVPGELQCCSCRALQGTEGKPAGETLGDFLTLFSL